MWRMYQYYMILKQIEKKMSMTGPKSVYMFTRKC